jgi:hypothetical protein
MAQGPDRDTEAARPVEDPISAAIREYWRDDLDHFLFCKRFGLIFKGRGKRFLNQYHLTTYPGWRTREAQEALWNKYKDKNGKETK